MLCALLGGVLEVCAFWQALCAVEYFAATDAGAPYSYVVGVFQFCEIGIVSVLVKIVNLFLSAKVVVACKGDDLYIGGHYEKCHVKTNLVVACSRAAVGYCIGAYLVGIARNGQGLKDAFGANRNGVAVVAQHIAEDHVFQ